MIKNWLIHGDTHGNFTCLDRLMYNPEETAVIILGDAGFDFYLNKTDEHLKQQVESKGYYIYWLKGNHEARCSDIPTYKIVYDENVKNIVYYDRRFPHLRGLLEYGIYYFGKYSTAVIGGAYSVDKWWRLRCAGIEDKLDPNYYNSKKTGWFYNEQLSADEMHNAELMLKGETVDFVFTHTCPISWEPTDLFLQSVDQSSVDKSTEIWLDELKDTFTWNIWCFGHFHADRLERPHVEQFYNDFDTLDEIIDRWKEYDNTGKLEWHFAKSPNFYMT